MKISGDNHLFIEYNRDIVKSYMKNNEKEH